jgi:hypothetical protein
MGEKTGRTGKLILDFVHHGVLEVQIKDNWYRVSSNHFRSFDGNRRITLPERQPLQREYEAFFVGGPLRMITEDYNGPVFVLETNTEVIRMDTETIVTNPYIKTAGKPSDVNTSRA